MKLTKHDQKVLDAIGKAGFLMVEADGQPFVPGATSARLINRARFQRLLDAGLLVPSGDTLFPECSEIVSQSYVLSGQRDAA